MADPICRWRNPYIATVVELIDLLPKEELPQQRAREIVKQRSRYDFYRTPYQLACQLGLYHETNNRYFPKFTYTPTEDEVRTYLQNWIIHYCVPNPYTLGFDNLEPFSIHSAICERLQINRTPLNWDAVITDIFGDAIGNNDILKNSINTYSPIVIIEDGLIRLKAGKGYENLDEFIHVDISSDRTNKEYFFDLFNISTTAIDVPIQPNQEIIQELSQQDINLINEIQGLPNFTQTEKNQIVAARIGQGFFRRSLIIECGFCPITLVDESKLLVASHIKPWRMSNNIERIDPKNGILLTPTFDKLFDQGFITFSQDKKLIISPSLSNENRNRLNLVEEKQYNNLPLLGREIFFEFHRNEIFKR